MIAVAAANAKSHKRTVTLGTATATIKPGSKKTIKVSLDAAGKKLLKARRVLKVRLSVTKGDRTLATKTVTFREAKKKRK